jgi:type VI secretion system protein ImpJ
MNYGRQPRWFSGQFLESQHLQYLTMRTESLLGTALTMVPQEVYGFASLEMDNSLLQSGTLRLSSMAAITQDGSLIQYPGNSRVPDLSFIDQWRNPKDPLDIYIGIRRYNPSAPNVSDDNSGRSRLSSPQEMFDYNDADRSVKIELLELDVRFFTSDDLSEGSDYEKLQCARLVNQDGVIQHDKEFSFAATNLHASPVLKGYVEEFYDAVMISVRKLEEIKSSFNGESQEYGRREARMMGGIQALSECTASMRHLLSGPFLHPSLIFQPIVVLIARLSVFSAHIDVTGSYRGGSTENLKYNHSDQGVCFKRAMEILPMLLDELAPSPRLVVPFVTLDQDRLYTEVPAHFFGESTDYFLLIESKDGDNSWLAEFQHRVKIAAQDDIANLTKHSLSGVPSSLSPTRPSGAPIRENAIYIKLSPNNDLWRKIEEKRGISIEWKQIPEGVTIELVAVQR